MSKVSKFLKNPLKNPWFWGFLFGITVVHIVRPFIRHIPDPPAIIGMFPDFSFKEINGRNGELFGSKELKGSVYILTIFESNSIEKNQKLMQDLKKIQELYKRDGKDISIVSIHPITRDNEEESFKEFIKTLDINFSKWHPLFGSKEEINNLKINAYEHYISEQKRDSSNNPTNDTKIIIIDEDGNNRGFYNTDDLGIDEVFNRAQHVLREYKYKNKRILK